nr:hypothetical protein [Tanacetum cinerariifolium]
MVCGMVSHLMTIHEKSSLHEEIHEEIHEEDHHENVVFCTSWSIDADTGELAISTALGAGATETRKTAMVRGLKYSSNMGVKHLSPGLESNCSEAIVVRSSNVT